MALGEKKILHLERQAAHPAHRAIDTITGVCRLSQKKYYSRFHFPGFRVLCVDFAAKKRPKWEGVAPPKCDATTRPEIRLETRILCPQDAILTLRGLNRDVDVTRRPRGSREHRVTMP